MLKHTRSSQDVEVKEEKDKVEKPKQHNSRTIATSKPIKMKGASPIYSQDDINMVRSEWAEYVG